MQTKSKRVVRRLRIGRNLYERTQSDGTKVYETDYTDPVDGHQRRKTLVARNKTEAIRAQRALAVKVDRGQAVAPSRRTLCEVSDEFLANFETLVAVGERSARSLERYRENLNKHILPALGRLEIQKVTPDHVALFIRTKREERLASWTIKGMLTPLGRIFSLAVRRGYIAENPLSRLEPGELPKAKAQSEPRTLSKDEIGKLLRYAPKPYRTLLATAVFSGVRLQELLGLTWQDVDFGASVIRVRWQLSRGSSKERPRRIPLKTRAGRRDIYLLPELASLLREHRQTALRRGYARPEDFVFSTRKGTPLNYRNVSVRGLDKAADAAKLNDGAPKLSMHDLRHTFASHLIRQGVDPVRAARQLGHARPSITLDVYAHDFEAARQTDDLGERLSAAFDGVLGVKA